MAGEQQRVGWLRKLFGNSGERLAVNYLKQKGYRIHARQLRNFAGEIDIVAIDGDCLVFVEVKTRSSNRTGQPAEAVDSRKQRQMSRTALVWLKKHKLLDQRARFDVISIVWGTGQAPQITHFENAFPPPEDLAG